MKRLKSLVSSSKGSEAQSFVKDLPEFHSSCELGARIGTGNFAEVYEVKMIGGRRDRGFTHAVKVLNFTSAMEKNPKKRQVQLQAAVSEAQLWGTLGYHPNVVSLHATFADATALYLLMDKCTQDLATYFSDQQGMPMASMMKAFTGMLQGIEHVHSHAIVHRDIKAENFLVHQDNVEGIKLCDFGLSAALPKGGQLSIISGTAPYMSPEMLNYEGYDTKTDVWSFGVIVYAMLFDEFPYTPDRTTSEAMKAAIRQGIPEPRFSPCGAMRNSISPDVTAWVQKQLRRDPERRPTATQVLEILPSTEVKEFVQVASDSPCHMHSRRRKPTLLFSFDYALEVGSKQAVPGATETQETMLPLSGCEEFRHTGDSDDELDDLPEIDIIANMENPQGRQTSVDHATPNRPFKEIVGMIDDGLPN